MRFRHFPITLLLLALGLCAFAEDAPIIQAKPLETALQDYFSHPGKATAKALKALISAKEYSQISGGGSTMNVSDIIEAKASLLESLITSKKPHAVEVALLLQCLYYDHHVQNELALCLGELAIPDPRLLFHQAESLHMSPDIFASILSCSGICGPDEGAEETLKARLNALNKYCSANPSGYCSAAVSSIKESIEEAKNAS